MSTMQVVLGLHPPRCDTSIAELALCAHHFGDNAVLLAFHGWQTVMDNRAQLVREASR